MSQAITTMNVATAPTVGDIERAQALRCAAGDRRGKLEVVAITRAETEAHHTRVLYLSVRCDCGQTFEWRARRFLTHEACPRCEYIAQFVATFRPKPSQEFTLRGFSHYRVYSTGLHGEYFWDCVCNCSKLFKVGGNKLSQTKRCPDCSLKRMGEQKRGSKRPKKNVPTPEIVGLVREVYDYSGTHGPKHGRAPTLHEVAAKTGWKVSALRDLAVELGLSRPESRPAMRWSAPETKIVAEMAVATVGRIKTVLSNRGFTRSRNEIRDRLLELGHLRHGPHYGFAEAATLLGFDDPARVERLVSLGKLKAAATDAAPSIERAEMRRFLLESPDDYTLAEVDRVFFTLLILKEAFADARGRTGKGRKTS